MRYRPEIDGLRTLAVVPVVFFHAGFWGFSGGFVGVDVFFVISGFLITTLLIEQHRTKTYSLLTFYEKRARRILPALFFVLTSCLPFAWHVMDHTEFRGFSRSLLAVLFFVSNIFFWKHSDYFDQATELNPLVHTWSLSVEEQFYIIFPLALSALWAQSKGMRGLFFTIMAIVSFALAETFNKAYPTANFYLLHSRAFELLLGSLAALCVEAGMRSNLGKFKGPSVSWIGVFLIIISVIFFNKHIPFPGIASLIPTMGTFLVLIFCDERQGVGRLLSSPLMRGVGLVSYSFYLWHQPLFAFCRLYSLTTPTCLTFACLTIASFILAVLTWKFIEQPFRNACRLSLNKFIKIMGIGFGLLLGFSLMGAIPLEIPFRITEERRPFLDAKHDNANHLLLINDEECYDRDPNNACVLGDSKKKPTIAFWGDSHAGALTLNMHHALQDMKQSAFQYTMSGCPPALNLRREDHGANDRCIAYSRDVMNKIKENSIETVIIAARYALYAEQKRFDNREGNVEAGDDVKVVPPDQTFSNLDENRAYVLTAFKDTIESLLRLSKNVILVYPIPEAGFDVPKTLDKLYRKQGASDFYTSTSYAVFKERTKNVRAMLDSIHHPLLRRVYPEQVFCNTLLKDRCIVHHKDIIYYWDTDHLSTKGAQLAVNQIIKRLESSQSSSSD